MTDATKASILLGTLILAALAGGGSAAWQASRARAALHQAAIHEGRALEAQQAEAAAKADRAAAQQQAKAQAARVAELERQLAHRPVPPPAEPVPADAPAALVVAGLQGLGLQPRLLVDGLALSLPDGRTVLGWGREAARAPALALRLSTLEDLAQAQRDQIGGLTDMIGATDRALIAADARAQAQQGRAEALEVALKHSPSDRPWSAGLLVGLDASATRRAGVYLTRSWGPVQLQVTVLGNTAALGGGIRF